MDLLQSFLLGLLQGLTEFLPISSSGHLALARILTDSELTKGVTFEVIVHFGTLCSIVLYYRKTLTELVSSAFGALVHPTEFQQRYQQDERLKLIGYILISMLPALIIGLAFEEQLESIFQNPVAVSSMLLVTGLLLFLTQFPKTLTGALNYPKGFTIGLAQAFAIIPGISRSGSTISAALFLGIKRETAANFSFLMVIPVIAGATLLEVKELLENPVDPAGISILVVGFLTSFISGYFALKYLIILLRKQAFHYFAYYCWLLGGVGLIYFLAFQ